MKSFFHPITIELSNGQEVEVELEIEVSYHDDSFDHEFGTERCGHWEVDGLRIIDTKPLKPRGWLNRIGWWFKPELSPELEGEVLGLAQAWVNKHDDELVCRAETFEDASDDYE